MPAVAFPICERTIRCNQEEFMVVLESGYYEEPLGMMLLIADKRSMGSTLLWLWNKKECGARGTHLKK